jgi:ricin-type beta-trefoil lectin protein
MRLGKIGFAAVIVGVVGVTGSAVGQAPKPPADAPSTVFGTNFIIKSQADQNFCMQVAPGSAEGRTVNLQPCSSSETQRFTFTHNLDDSNLIIESQGMCIDGRSRKAGDGQAMPVQKCRFGEAWRFAYLSNGTIKDDKNDKCLVIVTAAANAAVTLAACDATKPQHRWIVSKPAAP